MAEWHKCPNCNLEFAFRYKPKKSGISARGKAHLGKQGTGLKQHLDSANCVGQYGHLFDRNKLCNAVSASKVAALLREGDVFCPASSGE